MRLGFLALAALLLYPLGSWAAESPAVLTLARHQVESADYRLSGRLVRVDGSGARTNYGISIKARWFPGVLREWFEITSPSSARIHVLLEMRPDGESTIQIAHPGDRRAAEMSFNQWDSGPLGPAFSYEDFLAAQYFWAGQKNLGVTKYGVRDCDQLLSTPGAVDKTHIAAVKSCLDPASGFPFYVEKRMKGSGTLKEFTYFGLRQTRGVWWANQIEAKIRGRAGSTLLIVDRGTPEAHLGLNDFDPVRLTQF
jgi:hypothetical protein